MKIRTTTLSGLLLLCLALAACGPAATPPPTATQVPTNTPTATLAPTSTPTLPPTATPTATPNATATQAAKATQQAEQVAASVKSDLQALGIPVDKGSLAYYSSTAVMIPLSGHYSYIAIPILGADDLSATDFVLSTDITWESPGLSTCGIIFRSEPNLMSGSQYLLEILRLSGLPAWSISYMKDARLQNSPTGVKTSGALDQSNGGTNHIVLVAEGEKFTLYINDVRQGTYYDYSKQRLDGKLGYYAWQDTGNSSCTFENTVVWAY